ncbi:hypothetical protein Tco_0551100 [Tanacetum coccineum]
MLEDPYAEAALQAPPSPDYVPGPEEPEQAPPSPDYVPGCSPILHSHLITFQSDPEAEPEYDAMRTMRKDPIDYPA